MKNLQTAILSVPALKNARPLQKLAGGPTSDSWLLGLENSKAVLRIDKPLARVLCLDRTSELDVLEQVAHAGFGAPLIWADPQQGLLVTEYISGCHWTMPDACQSKNIERLALRLRELHSASISGPVLQIAETAHHYATATGTAQARELDAQVTATLQLVRSDLTECRFCHNDLGPGNILDAGNIVLLDWEYAAAGDPCFDLAGFTQQNRFSATHARLLLSAYYGGCDRQLERRFNLFSKLYDLITALWYLAACKFDSGDMTSRNQFQVILGRLKSRTD